MKLAAMALVVIAETSIWGKNLPVANFAPEVVVCMEVSVNSTVFFQAQGEASKIFEQVPLRITWSRGRACKQIDAIHVRLREETPKTLKPGALAYALPYQGTTIELFYDRIQDAVPSSLLARLLANVLVHEITHILQGVARHSETGVMKARWTREDYREMGLHSLPFAPEDIQMIQRSLQTRRERLEARVSVPTAGESR